MKIITQSAAVAMQHEIGLRALGGMMEYLVALVILVVAGYIAWRLYKKKNPDE